MLCAKVLIIQHLSAGFPIFRFHMNNVHTHAESAETAGNITRSLIN